MRFNTSNTRESKPDEVLHMERQISEKIMELIKNDISNHNGHSIDMEIISVDSIIDSVELQEEDFSDMMYVTSTRKLAIRLSVTIIYSIIINSQRGQQKKHLLFNSKYGTTDLERFPFFFAREFSSFCKQLKVDAMEYILGISNNLSPLIYETPIEITTLDDTVRKFTMSPSSFTCSLDKEYNWI